MSDQLLLRALRREKTERPPIWLMRQAGRYMSEYRAIREGKSFLELCKSPELCAEIMRFAVEKLGVDAAIIFSDLLPLLEPLGFELSYAPGDGPTIANPVVEAGDLARVRELEDVDALDFALETTRLTRRAVAPTPIIGFSGAPFTLAGYAIEGGTSRGFYKTKRFMKSRPEAWRDFASTLARSSARYLNAQIENGADVVQIFDSWVGCLSVEDFREYVAPATRELISLIKPGVPTIYFGAGSPALLPEIGKLGATCCGVDWRAPIDASWDMIGRDRAIQGNLDPATLLAPLDVVKREAERILNAVGDQPGFIFNLGHGVLKETPVETARYLVDVVKNWRRDAQTI